MSKYLDFTGLSYFASKIKTLINAKADKTHTHNYLSGLSVSGKTITYTKGDGTSDTITTQDTITTYSAGTGISLSGTTFSNSGVRSIASGSTNGTISVNTNGTSADVAVKGLGSAAYTASTSYATSGHTHNYAGSSTPGGAATTALACTGNSATATVADKAKNANSSVFTIPSNGTSSAEGGELHITNQDGSYWAIDTLSNNLRIFDSAGNICLTCTKGAPANSTFAGSADKVDGFHASTSVGYYLRPISYGTSALTSGSSSLTTGYVYLQYE